MEQQKSLTDSNELVPDLATVLKALAQFAPPSEQLDDTQRNIGRDEQEALQRLQRIQQYAQSQNQQTLHHTASRPHTPVSDPPPPPQHHRCTPSHRKSNPSAGLMGINVPSIAKYITDWSTAVQFVNRRLACTQPFIQRMQEVCSSLPVWSALLTSE